MLQQISKNPWIAGLTLLASSIASAQTSPDAFHSESSRVRQQLQERLSAVEAEIQRTDTRILRNQILVATGGFTACALLLTAIRPDHTNASIWIVSSVFGAIGWLAGGDEKYSSPVLNRLKSRNLLNVVLIPPASAPRLISQAGDRDPTGDNPIQLLQFSTTYTLRAPRSSGLAEPMIDPKTIYDSAQAWAQTLENRPLPEDVWTDFIRWWKRHELLSEPERL